MRFKLFITVLTIISLTARAQQEDSLFIRAIADEILVNGRAYENLRVLTKDVGARLAGSPGMVKAEAWGQKTLQQSGADKVWLQECMVPHWVRGGKDEAWVINAQKKNPKLDVLALGNSVATGAKGVSAPVMLVSSFDELDRRKDEARGKIVFYNYRFIDKYVMTFQSYSDAGRYRGQGPSRAARYGAVAVIVRSMSHAADNNPHTGATSYVDSLPKIPAVAIGLRDADKLAAMIGQEKEVKVYFKTMARMLPDTIGHNVIGELKGTEFPDEIITVGGHLDSWDPAEGAHDDGAGCVQSIEVLRALKALGYKPKRTIRVVLFANEENGLRGGNKYAEEAKAKNEKHFFALESDAGGFTPRGFGLTANEVQTAKIKSWKPLLEPYGLGEFFAGGGADITPLNKTQGTALAGLSPDSQRYFDVHHAASDVFENVNKRELELGAIAMAALIYLVDQNGL